MSEHVPGDNNPEDLTVQEIGSHILSLPAYKEYPSAERVRLFREIGCVRISIEMAYGDQRQKQILPEVEAE